MINSLSNYVSWWCNITEDISAFRGYAELDELEYHLDLLNRHKREMRDAIDELGSYTPDKILDSLLELAKRLPS